MQRGLPCILLSPRGSCRPPGHSEDVVLQGPEALVDNAKAVSSTATALLPGSSHFSVLACQCWRLGVRLS